MRSLYNRIAGQNLERLTALSDGVFAVAMTLLVLDLRAPVAEAVHSERELLDALINLAPRLVPYVMSFLTLGIFWLGQQAQLDRLTKSDRDLAWMHIGFLCAICLVPFSTALLAEFLTFRVALIVYWINILLMGVVLLLTWRHAVRASLLRDDTTPEIVSAICRRITVAQTLYAVGAALCAFSTYWSIAFIVLLQINYAVAPPWPLPQRRRTS
jgi:TMEM175 potassium channel family protein